MKNRTHEAKKGIVQKAGKEILLFAGSKISTFNSDGEVVEYLLQSDTAITPEHDVRLFQVGG